MATFAWAPDYALPDALARQTPEPTGNHLFNGEVVGIASTNPLRLHRGHYFDLLRSNRAPAHVDTTGQPLVDAIGASVLLVANDGLALVVRQGDRNASSRGLLAPSGSGGMDPADCDGTTDLHEAVRRAALRELAEETGLHQPSVSHDRVWIERQPDSRGKPEGLLLAFSREDAATLAQRQMRLAADEQGRGDGGEWVGLGQLSGRDDLSWVLSRLVVAWSGA